METGPQIRAARALLDWSAAMLAEKAGVSIRSVQRWESDTDSPLIPAIRAAIVAALKREGIEFGPNECVARRPQ